MPNGRVYLVGAGPGDPKLLTIRGKECLEEADVVIYDYLANPALLRHARETAEFIYVGRRGRGQYLEQDQINRLLVDKAGTGKTVVRLKGGDPFIFGRGGEEAEIAADAGISFEVIPGISSAIACPTYAGIPITHRTLASTVTIVTGHEDPSKSVSMISWKALGQNTGTLVFLMGIRHFEHIVASLLREGRAPDTPVAMIRWGTRSRQTTVTGTLSDIVDKQRKARIEPPAVIVVGDVVNLRHKLNWFERRPLFGKTVMLTRPASQVKECGDLLEAFGAETVACPTIRVVPPHDTSALDRTIDRIQQYHWLLFTSVNGVTAFFRRLRARHRDLRILHGVRVCCIGPRTADELERHGLIADLVPRSFQAEGVIDALKHVGVKGQRILIPRAEVARELLPQALREQGADVTVAVTYRSVKPNGDVEWAKSMFRRHEISAITFTSSSTVRNFVDLFGGPIAVKELLDGVDIASIGPITSGTIEEYHLAPTIRAKENTIPSLVGAIVEHYRT